jgi:hypothetical protein
MNREFNISQGGQREDRESGTEILEVDDEDRKPTASEGAPGTFAAADALDSDKASVKRKRKSPEKPWKKPKSMPKRPLSAYNLFFKDERERLLSAGLGAKQESTGTDVLVDESESSGKKSKQKKVSGIGFANLAKTIAAKWKELDAGIKAPYEKIASEEKKKYDDAVAIWRETQAKEKAKAKAAQKASQEEKRRSALQPPNVPNIFASDRSLGSFSDTSNPYPSEWFQASHDETAEHHVEGASVPQVVHAPPAAYDRRQYDTQVSTSWAPPRQQEHQHYLYQGGRYSGADPYMQYTQQTPRSGSYALDRSLFAHDTSGAATSPEAYREYYGQEQAMYYEHRRRGGGDMRGHRSSSLPASSRYEDYYQQRSRPSSRSLYYQQQLYQQQQELHPHMHVRTPQEALGYTRTGSSHPRSASMPSRHSSTLETHATTHPEIHPAHGHGPAGADHDDPYRSQRAAPTATSLSRPIGEPNAPRRRSAMEMEPIAESAAAAPVPNEEGDQVVESSLHSLTESLDDDAISFITSMKYS